MIIRSVQPSLDNRSLRFVTIGALLLKLHLDYVFIYEANLQNWMLSGKHIQKIGNLKPFVLDLVK